MKILRDLFFAGCIALMCALTACSGQGNNHCVPIEHPRLDSPGRDIPILLFIGTGTSPCDVVAIENILDGNHINYSTVNSSQFNSTTVSQLQEYRLLIVPGGDFVKMGKGLTTHTAANIRAAVQNGLSYFGVCAGGFLAGNSAYYNGFNLTSNVTFGFYAAAARGQNKAAVNIATAGGPTMDQYWENGPQFSAWGSVIGKYPDGTPAVVEGKCGSGLVILSGIHAEAPEDWRSNMTFTTPATTDNAYAMSLILAALNRNPLRHY